MENERNCNCTQWPDAIQNIVLVIAVATVVTIFFLV